MHTKEIHLPDEWIPADIIAFSGRGVANTTIKIATCSKTSHVAIIGWTPQYLLKQLVEDGIISEERLATFENQFLLFESTTLSEIQCELTEKHTEGVQAVNPSLRINRYEGSATLYRLTQEWYLDFSIERSAKLTQHLLAQIGEEYDMGGALLSGTKFLKHFWNWSNVDRSSLFCSEYIAGVLQHVHLAPLHNPSKITPGKMIQWLVDSNVYEPGVVIKE